MSRALLRRRPIRKKTHYNLLMHSFILFCVHVFLKCWFGTMVEKQNGRCPKSPLQYLWSKLTFVIISPSFSCDKLCFDVLWSSSNVLLWGGKNRGSIPFFLRHICKRAWNPGSQGICYAGDLPWFWLLIIHALSLPVMMRHTETGVWGIFKHTAN